LVACCDVCQITINNKYFLKIDLENYIPTWL
jgi:hypothetical protein